MKVDLEFVAEYNKSLTVLIPKRCRQHKKRPFCKVVRKNTTKTKIVTKTAILKLKMLLTPYILRRQRILGTSFYHYVHILSWQRSLHHYHYSPALKKWGLYWICPVCPSVIPSLRHSVTPSFRHNFRFRSIS